VYQFFGDLSCLLDWLVMELKGYCCFAWRQSPLGTLKVEERVWIPLVMIVVAAMMWLGGVLGVHCGL